MNTEKNKKKKKNSTIAINPDISDKLDNFCKKHNITKKDFISLSLSYFERTGVDLNSNDISDNISSLKEKLDSIIKLQADATIKLASIQQSTAILTEVKQDTSKLIEEKKTPRKLFGIFNRKE